LPGDLVFPDGFQWGIAMSAFQTEGNVENDWTDWAATGKAPPLGDACDSWNRWPEDVQVASDLGVKVFRMSIEWARIEPEEGTFDEAAIAHYHDFLTAVRQAGMEPLVTLHHFTNPRWVAEQGGWSDPRIVESFRAYAAFVGEHLGDVVDYWNPQNESVVYITGMALVSVFPGGKMFDVDFLRQMFRQTVFANAAGVDALRASDLTDADGDDKPVVSWLVHATSPTYPAEPASAADVTAADNWDYLYNLAFVNALVYGELDLDFDRNIDPNVLVSGLHEGTFTELKGRVDVLGINYYARNFVMSVPDVIPNVDALPCVNGMCGNLGPIAGDNGNEVYPAGLYRALKMFAPFGLPLFVSENGVADAEDDLRPAYLVQHLAQVHRAIADGVDVRGYLHWSLLDNYEWVSGYTMKFGLVAVDFETQVRTPRPSYDLYRDIVAANAVPKTALDQWPLDGIVVAPGD
jgi:beta-glucosidase